MRAAIYTRKSSEDGLDQKFNSLDAQREAAEAYITSQKSEGWCIVNTRYDDGGWSGGTIDRPGLKQLLTDIEAGKIDIVVVYKVDRLSRSLVDFARLVELFDRYNVSFISVTQALNTTDSIGRLTLNMLLSFAQFEREVAGERIREKIAASKAKGMWMGGYPPLGYDPKDRTLEINDSEASIVRQIFRRHLELGSVGALRAELVRDDIRTKIIKSKTGAVRGGALFHRGSLAHMLRNRVYLGQIMHKGKSHPGLHPPIIDHDLFDAVQGVLAISQRGKRQRPPSRAPLAGLLFDSRGNRMAATQAKTRHGKRYFYYTSPIQAAHPDAPRLLRRVSAPGIEGALMARLRYWTSRPNAGWADVLPFVKRVELHCEAIIIDVTPPPHENWTLASRERCSVGQHGALRISSTLKMLRRNGRETCVPIIG